MTWVKQKPYKGTIHQGCLNCPSVRTLAPLDMWIGVGFGMASATMDQECIFYEGHNIWTSHYHPKLLKLLFFLGSIRGIRRWAGVPILADIEHLALKDPDHDWRVQLEAPLRGRTYQRHGPGTWVLIDSNRGFA